MADLFKNLEIEAFRAGITPRTQESREWFRKKLTRIRRVNRNEILKDLCRCFSTTLRTKKLCRTMTRFL
jgi:hypothetical protein